MENLLDLPSVDGMIVMGCTFEEELEWLKQVFEPLA